MSQPLGLGEVARRITYDDSVITNINGDILGFRSPIPGGADMRLTKAITADTDLVITAAMDGSVITCTTALTITVPELLSPRPSFIVNAPPTGNVSLDPTGAAQLNGATTTLTRSRANNPAGFVVTAYAESDGYGVSGS